MLNIIPNCINYFIAVSEIAVINQLPFFDVLGVYYGFCKKDMKKNKDFKFYNSKAMEVAGRYLDTQKNKEYKNNKSKFENSLN
jgi:hypothetical protein